MSELFKKPTELTEQYLQKSGAASEQHTAVSETVASPNNSNRLKRIGGSIMLGLGIFGAGAATGDMLTQEKPAPAHTERYDTNAPSGLVGPDGTFYPYPNLNQTKESPNVPNIRAGEAYPDTSINLPDTVKPSTGNTTTPERDSDNTPEIPPTNPITERPPVAPNAAPDTGAAIIEENR
mgnify:CR=1 FL=1